MDKKILIIAAVLMSAILLLVILLFPSPQVATADAASDTAEQGSDSAAYASLEGSAYGDSSQERDAADSASAAVASAAPAQGSGQPAAGGLEATLEQIDDAVITYSPQGVGMIAPHLSSSNPDVRDAAIDGLVQLGERQGAEILRKKAKETTDMRLRKRLIDAAAFIELPPAEIEILPNQ